MPVFLAFDYGERRIGVAVGDDITGSARPLPTVSVHAEPDWKALERVIADWRPQALIVGLPLDEGGFDQTITSAARLFAEALRKRSRLEVHLADERFSSRSADEVLRQARASGQMSRRVRKGDRDGQAARVILEQWLAARPRDPV